MMIFSYPSALMVARNAILGSWQDILKKTFLTSGNETAKCSCSHLSLEAFFGVHPLEAGRRHEHSERLTQPIPQIFSPSHLPGHLGDTFLHRHPDHHLPLPYHAGRCRSPVLGEEPSHSGCEGRKGPWLKEVRRPWPSPAWGNGLPMRLPGPRGWLWDTTHWCCGPAWVCSHHAGVLSFLSFL